MLRDCQKQCWVSNLNIERLVFMSKLLIEKRNILNEIRRNDMTLQELRFFNFYLAKINPRDLSTRQVRFWLKDFQKIMDIKELKIDRLKKMAKRLVQKTVEVPSEDDPNKFEVFTLFQWFKVDKDEKNNQYYVEIDANEHALPLMFNFKEKYFKYGPGNIIYLTKTQTHMYELLKQYEPIGMRKFDLEPLKESLGIAADRYERWIDFKRNVLDPCQKALEEKTDIEFEYTKIKTGARVTGVEFTIKKNENYEDPLKLKELSKIKPAKPAKPSNPSKTPAHGKFSLTPSDSFTAEDLAQKFDI